MYVLCSVCLCVSVCDKRDMCVRLFPCPAWQARTPICINKPRLYNMHLGDYTTLNAIRALAFRPPTRAGACHAMPDITPRSKRQPIVTCELCTHTHTRAHSKDTTWTCTHPCVCAHADAISSACDSKTRCNDDDAAQIPGNIKFNMNRNPYCAIFSQFGKSTKSIMNARDCIRFILPEQRPT